MKNKRLLSLAVMAVLIVAVAGIIWAQGAPYNRPNPLMDYAPQEIGIYDTRYDKLGEMDCRGCHGDSLADRHHYSETVLIYHQCTPCHEIIPDPPGVVVIRDCTTSGCHSWDDVNVNGWHHNTNLSQSENCVACHNVNLVAEITPFRDIDMYPPSVVTPTPFSCENCHWEQAEVAAMDRDPLGNYPATPPSKEDAGHPSTYDHYNEWGQFVGYYEYGKPILLNGGAGGEDTHHMGFKGNVSAQCYKCHSNDPGDPSWDPYNEELIRYCEVCHDVSTLHTIEPHVGTGGTGDPPAVDGWDAVGFHAGGGSGTPTSYRTFYANEQCWGCHGDAVPEWEGPVPSAPVLSDLTPTSVCPTGQVELTGSGFGSEWIPGRGVQFKLGVNPWTDLDDVPIYSWTDTRIVIEIPGWVFSAGNYKVRVHCEDAPAGQKNSTQLNLTIRDCASPKTITPDSGPCTTLVILGNGTGNFGAAQDTLSAPGADDGVYHVVEVVASQGEYIALNVAKWTDTEVRFRFTNFFEDMDGDFIQDLSEPTIPVCEDLNVGTWSVYFKYIFYRDDDSSGGYSQDDTVYQVENSNSITFELTNQPFLNQLNPTSMERLQILKIIGINFGPTQTDGEVRIGSRNKAKNPALGQGRLLTNIKDWSNTRIKVKLGVPLTWVGTTKYVWVEKDGMKSNYKKLVILP